MTADLLIQRARLRGQGDGLFDITVKRSRLPSILPAMPGAALQALAQFIVLVLVFGL